MSRVSVPLARATLPHAQRIPIWRALSKRQLLAFRAPPCATSICMEVLIHRGADERDREESGASSKVPPPLATHGDRSHRARGATRPRGRGGQSRSSTNGGALHLCCAPRATPAPTRPRPDVSNPAHAMRHRPMLPAEPPVCAVVPSMRPMPSHLRNQDPPHFTCPPHPPRFG